MTRRVQLTDDERALARRSGDKAVYVAVVHFRGPRGRRYRPIRTDARVTENAVLQQAHTIRCKRYAGSPIVTGTELLLCDPLGQVIEAEELGIGRVI